MPDTSRGAFVLGASIGQFSAKAGILQFGNHLTGGHTIAGRYGAEPKVTYFETPVVVDNS